MSPATAYQHHIARRLADARTRDGLAVFVGHFTLYCDNPRCAMREIHAQVKEHDGPTPARLVCPACQRQLKPHAIHTGQEHVAERERAARLSVRAQLEQARARADGVDDGLVTLLTTDDSLPRLEEVVP